MNNKGFTLIEILAVIVIISIVGAIGIAAISSTTDKARRSSFVSLAKTYGESARAMRGQDRLPHDPKNGEAILIKLTALDGTDKNEDYETEFGEIVQELSYVAIVNDNYEFSYYITVIDTSGHCIINGEYSSISDKNVSATYNKNNVFNFQIASPVTTFSIDGKRYKVTSVHDNYVVAEAV